MTTFPVFQRLYSADVSEEFGGGEFSFTHYIRFCPDGTLRCCLKQDFTFPSGCYQDPGYMETLLSASDPEMLSREEILSGVWAPLEDGFSFTVFNGSDPEEAGTGSALPSGLLILRMGTPGCAGVTVREYTLC